MSLNELNNDILCASSKDHIVKDPIPLACSHGVCKNCLSKESDAIKCEICGKKQKIKNVENNLISKISMQKNLPELFDKLEKQMSDETKKLKGILILIWFF